MRYAICADLHDNIAALERVVADAHAQRTDHLIFLGDAGYDERLLASLASEAAVCTFGNWEVSGLARLPAARRDWVAGWPALHSFDSVICCHATPDMPAAARDTRAAAGYIRQSGIGWLDLFPRLHNNDEARWRALAALEEDDSRVAFHGHTHLQMVWVWETAAQGRRLRSFVGPGEFTVEAGSPASSNRYLVGVGSAGQPQDGPHLRYAIFDTDDNLVMLRALNRA